MKCKKHYWIKVSYYWKCSKCGKIFSSYKKEEIIPNELIGIIP